MHTAQDDSILVKDSNESESENSINDENVSESDESEKPHNNLRSRSTSKKHKKSNLTPKFQHKKYSAVNFIVAEPSTEEVERLKDTLNEALKSKNIKFNDDLVFHVDPTNTKSKLVQVMPDNMERVYRRFKRNSKRGIYGPFEVVYSKKLGYYVKATNTVEKLTLICEYSGTVVDHDATTQDNDAVMDYLSTNNASFVINSDLTGNLARFLCGINNNDKKSKSKENVKSALYNIQGSLHVLLYANRTIKKGEILYYNYNAGSFKEYETDKFE